MYRRQSLDTYPLEASPVEHSSPSLLLIESFHSSATKRMQLAAGSDRRRCGTSRADEPCRSGAPYESLYHSRYMFTPWSTTCRPSVSTSRVPSAVSRYVRPLEPGRHGGGDGIGGRGGSGGGGGSPGGDGGLTVQ